MVYGLLVSRMKTSILFLVVAVCVAGAAAQSPLELNLATTGGELFPVNPGSLMLVNAWLTAVSVNGAPPVLGGSVGPVTFTTPEFASGSVAAGGIFNAGGVFFISSPWDVDLTATFVKGTWTRLAFPNGKANFVLIAEITGTLVYAGAIYSFQGHTVEIAIETSAPFRGTHAAGGGSTDAVAQ